MAAPLRLETTKTGIEVCTGKPKLIIVGNWFQLDEETGFITQKSIDGVLAIIAKKMIDIKFTMAKNAEQNIMIMGDTMIITQSPRSSGEKMNQEQTQLAARSVMQQFFKYAAATGYFDTVDPDKLKENLDIKDEQGEG